MMQIILADDDEDDHAFFKECLPDTMHVELVHAYTGLDVLHHLTKAPAGSDHTLPDLIILDINMPKLDGISTLKKLKRENKSNSIPVYILTTTASDDQRKECFELGCAGFFTKPPHLADLKKIVGNILNDVHANHVRAHRDK